MNQATDLTHDCSQPIREVGITCWEEPARDKKELKTSSLEVESVYTSEARKEPLKENTPFQKRTINNLIRRSGDNYEFHHFYPEEEDRTSEEEFRKSIFDIHHSRVVSFGNQRPNTQLEESETLKAEDSLPRESEVTPRTSNLLSHHGRHFLNKSLLVITSEDLASDKGHKETSRRTISVDAKSSSRREKTNKRLYDYCDPVYLEKSRARRRKVSEVDIEVGLRLSRFSSNPYEGCVDKFSKRSKKVAHNSIATSERTKWYQKENLYNGSFNRNTNGKRENPADSCDSPSEPESQKINNNFQNGREDRRRSLSASPQRRLSSSLRNKRLLNRKSLSQETSPDLSPASSRGPSSPAVNRYRKTNFATILVPLETEADGYSSLEKKEGFNKGLLPDINQGKSVTKPRKKNDYFSSSLPSSLMSNLGRRADSFTALEDISLRDNGSLTNNMNDNKTNAGIQDKHRTAKNASPGSLRKYALLNANLPTASPTFQRAMKGIKAKEKQSPKVAKERGKSRDASPSKVKMSKQPSRITSAGGRRIRYKDAPPSPKTTHRISFREPSHDDLSRTDVSATLDELRDQLGNLSIKGPDLNAVPSKSILKSRRRSIDDLDVGTKKGLAQYLMTKQKESEQSQESQL